MSTALSTFKLNPECIVKQGYLIKSPPMEEKNFVRKRWRKRWFVLYDTQPECHADSSKIREVYLYYYKTDVKVVEGPPKGKINLHGCAVFKQRCKLYGYENVINLQTNYRLYHLCATQIFVCDEWLEKLSEHHVPFNEPLPIGLGSRCNSSVSNASHCRRKSVPAKTSVEKKRPSLSTRSVTMDSISFTSTNDDFSSDDDDDVEYEYPQVDPSMFNKPTVEQIMQPKMKTEIKSWLDRTSVPIPVYKPPIPRRFASEICISEIQEDHYEGMEKLRIMNDSEDEGIGRTDSESSSTTSSRPITSFQQTRSVFEKYTPTNNTLSDAFVGPKFSVTSTPNRNPLSRARSLGDIVVDTKNMVQTRPLEF